MGVFRFKEFDVDDSSCGMKICSDSVLLAAWFLEPHRKARNVADIGAGSGVLSLLAAQICAESGVTGVEMDSAAAEAARQNFRNSPFADRLTLVEADFCAWQPTERFELIISNPPYFTNGEHSADAARCTARHQEGLTYTSLLNRAKNLLSPGDSCLGFVSPAEFESDIIFRAEMCGLKLRRLMRVRTSNKKGVTRLLLDFSLTDGSTAVEEMNLRNADGSYSESYLRLVAKYYLKI